MAKMGVAIFTVLLQPTDRGGLHPANSGRFKLYSPATLRVKAELRNYWTAEVENTKYKKQKQNNIRSSSDYLISHCLLSMHDMQYL